MLLSSAIFCLLTLIQLAVAKTLYSTEQFTRPRHHSPQQQQHYAMHSTQGGDASASATTRVNRCYSCMSPLYAELFKGSDLGNYFYEPRNFTSQCDDPMEPQGIGLVPCRGICLTLAQEFVIMGRRTGKRLTMRGCAASLSRLGYLNRTIAYFAEFDLCREVHPAELFRLAEAAEDNNYYYGGIMSGAAGPGPMDGQPILVCSCLGDKCNRQATNSSSSSLTSSDLTRILLLFVALIWNLNFQHY